MWYNILINPAAQSVLSVQFGKISILCFCAAGFFVDYECILISREREVVTRQAHNLEIVGSIPTPAIIDFLYNRSRMAPIEIIPDVKTSNPLLWIGSFFYCSFSTSIRNSSFVKCFIRTRAAPSTVSGICTFLSRNPASIIAACNVNSLVMTLSSIAFTFLDFSASAVNRRIADWRPSPLCGRGIMSLLETLSFKLFNLSLPFGFPLGFLIAASKL